MSGAYFPVVQPTPVGPPLSSSALTTPQHVNANAAFLGYGVLAPFRRDQKQDFANAGGVELVRSCVAQILGTQCSVDGASDSHGELLWRPGFGSLLYRLRHMNEGHALNELAHVYVSDALKRWEPRVVISSTSVTFDRVRRALVIALVYDVIDQNVPGNAVVIADVYQAINIPLAA